MTDTVTGIELTLGPHAGKLIDKALHALHVDRVTGASSHMLVSLDGAVTDLPIDQPSYVLQCPPGDHVLGVAIKGFAGRDAFGAAVPERVLALTVRPGELVRVVYQFESGLLELAT